MLNSHSLDIQSFTQHTQETLQLRFICMKYWENSTLCSVPEKKNKMLKYTFTYILLFKNVHNSTFFAKLHLDDFNCVYILMTNK